MFFSYKSKGEIDKRLIECYNIQSDYNDRLLRLKIDQKKAEYFKELAKDWKEYEHEYHSGMEERKVQLAKLDAEIEYKQKIAGERDAILEEKNKTIELLTELVKLPMGISNSTFESHIHESPTGQTTPPRWRTNG